LRHRCKSRLDRRTLEASTSLNPLAFGFEPPISRVRASPKPPVVSSLRPSRRSCLAFAQAAGRV
jgi:hypothetical protein